jgi:hypothetical protein
MKNLLFLIFCPIIEIGMGQTLCPQVYSSGGSTGQIDNSYLSWTIGECVIQTIQNSSSYLTQGFQQTKMTINEFINEKNDEYSITISPNPNKGSFVIETDILLLGQDITFRLTDINSIEVMADKLTNVRTEVDISQYNANTYILTLYNKENTVLRSYKIFYFR